MIVYIIVFIFGVFIGFALLALLTANSNSEKMREAYKKGYDKGVLDTIFESDK